MPDSFLDGITRRCVIEIAKSKGIKIVERKIKPEEMSDFVGCFLTGTAAEVAGIKSLNDYQFPLDWEDTIGYFLSRKYRSLVLNEVEFEVFV